MTQWGIDTLFNPGKRHMDEEKRRLQSTREEIGDSSGGKRIDLESGKVRLAGQPGKDEAEPDEVAGQAAEDQDESAEHPADQGSTDESPAYQLADESPADEREDSPAARARRRRRAG